VIQSSFPKQLKQKAARRDASETCRRAMVSCAPVTVRRFQGTAAMKTNVVRIKEQHAAAVQLAPAQIIPFPVPVRTKVRTAPGMPPSRPNLGVNIVLALILILACLLWEVMVIPSSTLVDAGHTAVTSPRALLDGARARPVYGVA
jgi:hypothetical protein